MQKTFTFGIDFDETLATAFLDGNMIAEYNQKFHKNISVNDLTDFYFENMPWFLEIYTKYMDENHGNLPFFADAKAVLQNLKNRGIKLIIITSREPHYKTKTLEYIQKEFGDNFFEKILFTSDFSGDDKASLARAEGCDAVIDDAAHHIIHYIQETDAMVFRMDAPWNRNIADSDRIIGVKTWKEVEEKILAKL